MSMLVMLLAAMWQPKASPKEPAHDHRLSHVLLVSDGLASPS